MNLRTDMYIDTNKEYKLIKKYNNIEILESIYKTNIYHTIKFDNINNKSLNNIFLKEILYFINKLNINIKHVLIIGLGNINNTADSIWSNYWSGIMSWYIGGTNDNEADEIILHRAGHAYHHTIYLRTIMTTSSDGRHLRLQIAADTNLSTAVTYTFKFKRVI